MQKQRIEDYALIGDTNTAALVSREARHRRTGDRIVPR